jgi:FkbM family methyltransferase
MSYGGKKFTYFTKFEEWNYPIECFDTETSRDNTHSIIIGKRYGKVPYADGAKVILDIGANVGTASMMFSFYYPLTKIYSFEPEAESYTLLEKNMKQFPNVRTYPFGFHTENKLVESYRSPNDPGTVSIGNNSHYTELASSIELRNPTDWLKENKIPAIDILKIDTEGCEVPILMSMKSSLPVTKLVYLEYHSEQDRKAIDILLSPTHVVCAANARYAHLGEIVYARKDLGAPDSELHKREIKFEK